MSTAGLSPPKQNARNRYHQQYGVFPLPSPLLHLLSTCNAISTTKSTIVVALRWRNTNVILIVGRLVVHNNSVGIAGYCEELGCHPLHSLVLRTPPATTSIELGTIFSNTFCCINVAIFVRPSKDPPLSFPKF